MNKSITTTKKYHHSYLLDGIIRVQYCEIMSFNGFTSKTLITYDKIPQIIAGISANGKNEKASIGLLIPFATPIPNVVLFCLIIERIKVEIKNKFVKKSMKEKVNIFSKHV